MKNYRVMFSGLLLALLSVPLSAAEPAWVARSNDNAKLLLNVTAKYSPEQASGLGIDGYDDKISDLSRDQHDAMTRDTRAVIAELEKRLASEKDAKVRQDLEILIASARESIDTAALNRKYFMPFIDLTGMMFGVTRQLLDPRIPKDRQRALLARLEKYTGTAKGYRPITELAYERLQERLKANKNLLGPFKGQVEQSLARAPVTIKGMRDLLAKSELSGWEPLFARLETQLAAYNELIRKEVLPRARTDHRLPPEVYANNLREYGVDISPEELKSKALTSFAEIRNQMNITAGLLARERKLPNADYRAVMAELKKQQLDADKVMPLYAERLAQLEDAVRKNHVVTLPTRKAVIRLASPAENAQQPAPHMNPPRLVGNTGEYGEFVLTSAMPPDATGKTLTFDDFTHQAGAWTLTAHEARPGHELQFAKMIETGVSTARAVFAFNSVNVEGWALYAEAEMQPYQPLDGQLFALQHRALRAARAFLDPMVNQGELTPEAAKAVLMEDVGLSEGMATQEVQRYTFRAPGQATSYFYGYQRLMETRQLAQVALRDKFNRLAFNDFVLAQGLVPPPLLRKAVMEEFVPSQK
ncbi:DUF885 domain-containing protein [Massilia sp. PAMC28688]|uniref:DUF885 domain-containing protein n=1 Tax=Massilia sp. PAMC28688 TaxID=2861283 RepID=UPI001C63473C|nr:DUF885 domain-containing protein [Massilia sp. PAMC28688]QYF94200.1 DUF885 domain-containing protein [Massilia sp. PAMC28688]